MLDFIMPISQMRQLSPENFSNWLKIIEWGLTRITALPPRAPFFSLHCVCVCIGEGNGTPHQCSCLENPMDGGAWWAAVHGVAKSRTQLSNFTFTFQFHAWEKEMSTHFSILAWRIPGTGEPGGLPSLGSHRVGHDWGDSAAAAAKWSSGFPYFLQLKPEFWIRSSWS